MINSTISKKDDGEIQIIFTIPKEEVKETKSHVLEEIAKDANIPGFRKGKAPVTKVEEAVSVEKLNEHILSHILPKAFADSIEKHKIKPAIYPKFEAIKLEKDSDWEIMAKTCELPEVELGDYKKKIEGELRSKSIVVPGKEEKQENKQDAVIKALLNSIKIKVPGILIDEEVNARLSSLLARIERLGLQLEGYLKSVGKTPESLREEYVKQAETSITLELALNKIAEEEKLEVKESEIDEFIKSTGSTVESVEKDQRDALKRVILRKNALELMAGK